MTVPSALVQLLALQELDTGLDQHRHRRATLPERAELEQLASASQRLDAEAATARSRRDEVATRQTALEGDLAATERRVKDINGRLYGGTVSAARDLQALATELEVQRSRASELEDRILALLEEREPLDAVVDALEDQLTASARSRQAVEQRLAAAEAVIDEQLAALSGRRGQLAATVPADLLATYDRLRSRLGGTGAARLVGDRCGGCHLSLPAMEIDRLRHAPEDALKFCDQCGRILVLR